MIPDEREISDAVLELIGLGLTEKEASETSRTFPCPLMARQAVEFYFCLPDEVRTCDYLNYSTYLERLRSILAAPRETNLFEEEIAEKTQAIPQEALMQTRYRDTPRRSEHYVEHLFTQMLG